MKENTEDKVWITVTRKVNLGNYESAEIQAGFSQSIKDEQDPLELIREGEKKLISNVNKKSEGMKHVC